MPKKIFCNTCKNETNHTIIRSYDQVFSDNEIITWLILSCAGCDTVSFCEEHVFLDGSPGPDNFLVFPLREKKKVEVFSQIPANLGSIYRETILAFNNSLNVLCAGGLRALVEGICSERGIVDGPKRDHNSGNLITNKQNQVVRSSTLDCKIEGLAELNILTPNQAKTLHELRYLGNGALHNLDFPTLEALLIAINIIEHVMTDLYNLPEQAAELMLLRKNK